MVWVLMQGLVAEAETGKDAAAFTQRALALRAKFVAILEGSFGGDRLFMQALHSAFEARCSIYLAHSVVAHGTSRLGGAGVACKRCSLCLPNVRRLGLGHQAGLHI